MRKLVLVLSLSLFIQASLSALGAGCCGTGSNVWNGWPLPKPCARAPWPSPFVTYGTVSFRHDKFKWSIPGANNFPNTLSEIQWRDLRMVQYGLFAEYTSCANYTVRLEGDYGHIYHGRYSDADYLGNDKTYPFSISRGNGGKGYVYDASAAMGYRFTSTCKRFVANPLVGYSQHAQYLHMYDGFQAFSFNFLEIGPIPGLNNTYTTRWFGPWFGLDFEARIERCASIFGVFKWHMLTYRGHGHWNLRTDISPFNHRAYGYGYEGTLGTTWEIWGNWSIGLAGSYRMFRTKHGHESITLYFPGGFALPITATFSGAIWHSYSISGLISWRY